MKPSRYLLLTFAAFGAALWGTGRWPFDAGAGEGGPVVVRRDRAPGPQPFSGHLQGRVFDPLGWPLAGAEVALRGSEAVATDAEGRFRLPVTGTAPVDLVVRAPSFRSRYARVQPCQGDPLWFQLEPRAAWDEEAQPPELPEAGSRAGDGFVRDAEGQPVAGALVTVVETGFCTRTDSIGHYTLALPDGPATLVVQAENGPDGRGLAARSEPLNPVRREGLVPLPELRLTPGTRIRGTVRDPDGNPVAGAPLVLRGEGILRRLETDAEGVFSLAGLLTGHFELVGLAYRGALGFVDRIELGPGGFDRDFHLRPDVPRRVQVTDTGQQALPDVAVAVSAGGQRRYLTGTDPQGFCELRGLEPEADIEVRRGEVPLPVVAARPEEGTLVVSLP